MTFELDVMLTAPSRRPCAPRAGCRGSEFALAELWEARDVARGAIPASALAAMGGVAGALGRHADDVLARMMPQAARAARGGS